jgi:class 3 adenylate cyclase
VRAGTARSKTAPVQLEAEFRRREEVLRQTFRRYVSPRVADKILEDPQLLDTMLSTADVRTHAVVLFADLRGFTSISEQLEPHCVVPLLRSKPGLASASARGTWWPATSAPPPT